MNLERRITQLEAKLNARDQKQARIEPQFIDESVPEQAAFIRDPARRKLVFSTRRGGKSYGEGRFMLQEAWRTPNVSCLYIGLTRDSAWRTMWRDVLKDLNTKLDLGARFNETKLLMTLPNDSTVQLLGLDATEDEKAKLLGGKYKVVVIDEAASFTIDLDDLVTNTLGPAVADLSGTIIMSGTPSNVHAGVFFDLTKDQNPMLPGLWQRDGWSCHRWSYEQNHYIRAQVERDIAALIAARPLIEKSPGFKMNWKGQWCVDDTLLVYKWQLGRNTFDGTLPNFRTGRWHYTLGIDTGWKATAFTLGAYHDHSPNLYLLESWKRRAMDITAMRNAVRWYEARFDIERKRIDGANKQAVEEMNNRHGLSLEAADKRDKFEFIDIMNDDFAQERIFVSVAKWETGLVEQFTDAGRCGTPDYVSEFKCGLLQAEFATLVIDESKLKRLRKREEQAGLENHCCDSALYEWRDAYPYLSKVLAPPPPKLNSPEWHAWHQQYQHDELNAVLERQMAANRDEQQRTDAPLDWL